MAKMLYGPNPNLSPCPECVWLKECERFYSNYMRSTRYPKWCLYTAELDKLNQQVFSEGVYNGM